ncbi:hypothetical protein ES288_D03G154800v1 [Gossypium darwinii]|uniref:DUF659 domain-containing protein n=1 Tax=Gossypium darwinii TaxID=34276 RepID=A0A5D2D9A6_GOSDA|nr:hypothetical protein ES288_D03G154800v1 [Gossypium darwinii]
MTPQSGSGSVDSSNNVTNASVSQDDISNTPLWRYVTKLPKIVGGGENVITLQHLAEMQKIVEYAKLKLQQKIVPLSPRHSLGSKRRKIPLEQSFNLVARKNLDSEIARMFYFGGLPFHLARNSHYVNAFTLASKKSISGGAVFLQVVNCEKEYKDKFYVATLIKDAISEVGAQNVVQVITGNALVCKAVGSLVETQHPHIFWTPCVVHTLNLTLKTICVANKSKRMIGWLNEVPNRLPPHKDIEITEERNKNWSTYSFIHSMRRNKINLQRAEDLVFVHNNLRLLSRNTLHYKEGENKMWDIGGDVFDSFEGVGILGVASLSLDESDMEMVIFANEEEDMENANAMN